MRRKKNKIEGSGDAHRWIISYADFITLLFAFFVVMYAISSVNDSKYQSLSQGMHSAFNKKDQHKGKQDASKANKTTNPASTQKDGEGQDPFTGLQAALKSLGDGDYKVNGQEGWVEIDIEAGSLFIKGNAELKPEAMVKLMRIASVIKNMSYPVALEGYTDNLPIETPQYPSNWELSAARAAAVGRALNTFGVASGRISVTGFGEQFPIADNLTAEGQAKNRRVNILISKEQKTTRMYNPNVVSPVEPRIFPLQDNPAPN
jgi:chemotaxis protein MotB